MVNSPSSLNRAGSGRAHRAGFHRAAAITVAAALALAGCGEQQRASAPPSTWSAKQYPAAGAAGGRATLGVGADGASTAAWVAAAESKRVRAGVTEVSPSGATISSRVVRGAPIDAPVAGGVGAPGAIATLGTDGSVDAAGLWVTQLSDGGTNGATTELVAPSTEMGNAALASGPDGSAVLAWFERGVPNKGVARLRVASRSARGTWSAPVTLQQGGAPLAWNSPCVAVAIAPGGDAIVAARTLQEDKAGLLAWRSRDGKIGAPVEFAPKAFPSVLRAAITTSGAAVVAWSEQAIGFDVDTPMSVSAVSLGTGSAPAGDVQTIDPGTLPERPEPGLELVTSPTGGAILAWTQRDKAGTHVSVATSDGAGRFSTKPQVIPGLAGVGGLAVRPDGAALLTAGRVSDDGAQSAVVSWLRRPGDSTFTALDTVPVPNAALVAPFDTSGSVDPGSVHREEFSRIVPGPAFDPKTGDALVAFTTGRSRAGSAPVLTVLRRSVR